LKEGQNTLAVRVDNSKEPSTRWYHPCGIYAPVRLIVTNTLHFAPNSIFVSTPEITKESAHINVDFKLNGIPDDGKETITEITILSPEGKVEKTVKLTT